jgi:hypothetical protein
MLPSNRPSVARAGCIPETRLNIENITRSLDGLPLLVALSAFNTDIFPKLQADISVCVNLLCFANLAPTFSNHAQPQSNRFVSRLGHGALAFFTSGTPTTGRLSEFRDKFPEHYAAVFL